MTEETVKMPPKGAEDHLDLETVVLSLHSLKLFLSLRNAGLDRLRERLEGHIRANVYPDGTNGFDVATLKNARSELEQVAQMLDQIDNRLIQTEDALRAIYLLWRDGT